MNETKKTDMVNHPPHYEFGGIDSLDFIIAKKLGYCIGNVVKYLTRAGHKGDYLEDLQKAEFYLKREIKEEIERRKQKRGYE